MFFRNSAAIIIGVSIFLITIISGDFGTNVAFSQTDSTSQFGHISEGSKNYLRKYYGISDAETGEIIIRNPNFEIPTEVETTDRPQGDLPPETDPDGTGDEEEVIEEEIGPILPPEVIEQLINDTQPTEPEEVEEVVDTVFTLTDIADVVIDTTVEPERPISTLSEECQALGARSRDECDRLLTIAFLPDICRENGIRTKLACDTFLIQLNDKPVECQNVTDTACRVLIEEEVVDAVEVTDIIERALPQHCVDRGATTIRECEELKDARLIPAFCREKGATTEEECRMLLNAAELPQVCKDAEVMTREGCARVIIANTDGTPEDAPSGIDLTPSICKDNNIAHDRCREIIVKQTIRQECQELGLTTQEECNQHHIDNTLPNYCTSSDEFEDVDACTRSLTEELRDKVRCDGSNADSCKDRAAKHYFGEWIQIKQEHDTKQEALEAFKNTHAEKISNLPQSVQAEIRKSLLSDRPIYLHSARGDVVINRKNELKSLPNALIVFDDDGDGLSNELERRLGTDPQNSDTDGDGFDDRTELRNGFNPSGEGKRLPGLWPVDNAMIFGLPLEQPEESSAPVDETFEIEDVTNATGEEGLELSGTATKDSLVTLYVYSSLPMVLTVETDSDGNWNYTLQESLVDGEHEVYVALVSDIGEIERRSEPLSFFVNQARAVSIDDFFGGTVEEAPPVIAEVPVDDLQRYYLYGAGIILLLGLIVVVFFILRARNKEIEPPKDPDIAA